MYRITAKDTLRACLRAYLGDLRLQFRVRVRVRVRVRRHFKVKAELSSR